MKFALSLALSISLLAAAPQGAVERIKIHSKALEGNLEGDSPDRYVSIYLPPSYATNSAQRYPVVYLLHGFTDSDNKWFGMVKHWINLPEVIDKAAAKEMIVVMPNAFTRYEGSMYSNSVTIGDWETFVAEELVGYIDSHYRTIAKPASRGLAGHSMGGYGTIRLAMKKPGVFSSIYLLSPCCMAPQDMTKPNAGIAKAQAIKDPSDVAGADFFTKAMLASAAAWSPDPTAGPMYVALPPKPEIAAKWTANAPLAMLDQYIPALKRLTAIAFDAGDKDEPIASTVRSLDKTLTTYGIEHQFEIYEGNHINHVADRIAGKMLPFFGRNLQF